MQEIHLFRYANFFFRINENKKHLFQLLAAELIQQDNFKLIFPCFKSLAATKSTVILTNIATYLPSQLTPCNYEEADTRIFAHVEELVLKGRKVVLVDATDTDVVVVTTSCFSELSQFGFQKL